MPPDPTTKTRCTLILALDLDDPEAALQIVRRAGSQLEWVKIGLQMFTLLGPDYVKQVADEGKKIFLDLKLHDIPNTVAKAVESVSRLPIQMLTLHTCGGAEMMQRAVAAQRESNPKLQLLGVTVLTSMDQAGLARLGIQQSLAERVTHLALLARESGLDGLVCSTQEVAALKQRFRDDFILVTPGIRPAGTDAGDQKRVMTPTEAREIGADYIVVGRPIYESKDPAEAVSAIVADLAP